MNLPNNESHRSAGYFSASVTFLWRVFSSVKLTVILILILVCLSLIGTFFSSVSFFHSWWFIAPGVLLMLNILICSVNRWKNIRAILRGGTVVQPDGFFTGTEKNSRVLDVQSPSSEASRNAKEALRKHGYRVRTEGAGDRAYLAADINRYYKLGTFVSHLSLILFVLAYVIGTSFGFRDTSFIVAEGETIDVGHDTGLSLNLLSFEDEYYEDYTPKDYRSDVILYKDGVEVDRALIRVNHPLFYGGIRFYQSFFGPAVRVDMEQEGNTLFDGSVALTGMTESQGYRRYAGYLELVNTGLVIRFISSAVNAADPMIPEGGIAVDVRRDGQQIGLDLLEPDIPVEVGGMVFTYGGMARFSGFQVSSDPGNALIWVASALFLIGIIMVLYFAHRQVWIMIEPLSPGNSRISVRISASRAFNTTSELNKLLSAVNQGLSGNGEIGNAGGLHGSN